MLYLHNFTGVFEKQSFYLSYPHQVLAWKNLTGVRGYLEQKTAENIQKTLCDKVALKAIHFLDSGNYHHFSYLYLKRIKEPFHLVVYDNHTDMQSSAFGRILSCGSWIEEAYHELPFLKHIVIVGAGEEGIKECRYENDKRIRFVSSVKEAASFLVALPLYLSIDKDVLSEEEFRADWDQGTMRLFVLSDELSYLRSTYSLLGADVCGEPDPSDLLSIEKSDRINSEIVKKLIDF